MSDAKQTAAAKQNLLSQEEKLKTKNTRREMIDMLLVLAAPVIMSVYYYGERALRLTVLSVLTAVICELVGKKVFGSASSLSDLSCLVTGTAVAVCLPASSQWWLPCVASAFAILVVKLPFGNRENALFVPSAAGIAFVTICSSEKVFAYPFIKNGEAMTVVYGKEGFVAGDSVAYMLTKGNSIGTNVISYINILIGNVAGPMGAACAIAMLGGVIYMSLRKPKNAVVLWSYLLACFIYAVLFPRITTGRLTSAFMELTAGLLLFGAAIFMSNDSIAPKRLLPKLLYGAFAGLLVMLLRGFSGFEDSTVFAVLLANAVAPAFDRHIPLTKREKKALEENKADGDGEPQAVAVTGGEVNG